MKRKLIYLSILFVMFFSNSVNAQDYSAFVKNGKLWSIIDENGNSLNEGVFYTFPLYHFYNGYIIVKSKDKEWGFLSSKGKFFKVEGDYLSSFSEGMAAIKVKDDWGFVDLNIKFVIKPQFMAVKPFRNGKTWVKIDNKWTQIDKTGKQVFSEKYDAFEFFENGFAKVRNGDKWGFINLDGKIVGKGIIYDDVEDFYNGFACVKKDN
ncbi:MAG: hypothetical protein CO118_02880, partial [Flavobacteriales bacterium CG_4_9_14_3_um_filter_32_8]